MTAWHTTVDHLVFVFRDALRALVPHLERVRIEWRDGAAYDDWDEIAQTLYQQIVVASLLWAMPEEDRDDSIPRYDVSYKSYAGRTVICVNRFSTPEKLVFRSFATANVPFDKILACRVSSEGLVIGDVVLLDADGATFSVETPARTLVEITVDL